MLVKEEVLFLRGNKTFLFSEMQKMRKIDSVDDPEERGSSRNRPLIMRAD